MCLGSGYWLEQPVGPSVGPLVALPVAISGPTSGCTSGQTVLITVMTATSFTDGKVRLITIMWATGGVTSGFTSCLAPSGVTGGSGSSISSATIFLHHRMKIFKSYWVDSKIIGKRTQGSLTPLVEIFPLWLVSSSCQCFCTNFFKIVFMIVEPIYNIQFCIF